VKIIQFGTAPYLDATEEEIAMNDFILKHKITSEKLFAYVSFYYLIFFFCTAATPKTFFGFLVVVALALVPFTLLPKVVRSAVFELGGGTQDQSKNAAFKVKCFCAFMGVLMITMKAML
jgi:hypothetical protein